MDNRSTLAAIHRGEKVPKKDLEAAIASMERIKEEAETRGLASTVERIEQTIQELRTYKRKPLKPRTLAEIQRDIDSAQQLVILYRNSRKYELAAQWERSRDEFMEEWDLMALGRRRNV